MRRPITMEGVEMAEARTKVVIVAEDKTKVRLLRSIARWLNSWTARIAWVK
jgi:nickel-dependent lactate racemase